MNGCARPLWICAVCCSTQRKRWTNRPVESVERAALYLRKTFEGVALFSLVVNRDLLTAGERAIRVMDGGDAGKALRKLNPAYWPKPQRIERSAAGEVTVNGVHEGFLRESDYGRTIGTTSDWLHWRNPYKPPLTPSVGRDALASVFDELEVLLRAFTMSLPGETNLLLCAINIGRPGSRDSTTPPRVVDLSRVGDLPN